MNHLYGHNRETAAPSVSALVIAARDGSSHAFAELQALYSARLYRTILRITKNEEDAKDVLQDTFLRAFLSLRGFQGRSSVYSWMTRIAINCALMLLRRRRIRPEVYFDDFSDGADHSVHFEIQDSAPDPEHICGQRQLYSRTLQAIQKLEPSLRSAISLHATHNYSLEEIAGKLKISEAAVKSRLYRARARLRSGALNKGRTAEMHLVPPALAAQSACENR
jgi:RNA polymerase sigma-70 factor, ECF subfamily